MKYFQIVQWEEDSFPICFFGNKETYREYLHPNISVCPVICELQSNEIQILSEKQIDTDCFQNLHIF